MRRTLLTLGIVVVLLAVAVLWPAPSKPQQALLWKGSLPGEFTVTADGTQQVIAAQRVQREGWSLPADSTAISSVVSVLSSIAVPPERMLSAISASAALAYGCTAQSELRGQGVWFRWGSANGQWCVWDGISQRLAVMSDKGQVTRLHQAVLRLDQRRPVSANVQWLRSGSSSFVKADELTWNDAAQPLRTALSTRVKALITTLSEIEITSFAAEPLSPALCRIESGEQPGVGMSCTLHPSVHGLDGWIRFDALPPQRLSTQQWLNLRALIDDLNSERIVEKIDVDFVQQVILPNATLLRRTSHAPWEGAWEVSWSGGREGADPNLVLALMQQMQGVVLDDLRPGPLPATTARMRVILERGVWECAVLRESAHWRLGDGTRHGRLLSALPTWVELSLESMLDPRPLAVDGARIVKIQRESAERSEVLSQGEDLQWRRTWPATAAGAVAADGMRTLINALTSIHGSQQGTPDAEDRAALSRPWMRLLVRTSAVKPQRPADDLYALSDTVGGDSGWCIAQVGTRWRMIDLDGRRARTISEQEALQCALALPSAGLLPMLPGDIRSLQINARDGSYRIERVGERWVVPALSSTTTAAAETSGADAYVISRLLRALCEAPSGGEALTAPVAGTVVVQGERARHVLSIGRADSVGRCAVTLDGAARGWVTRLIADELLPSLQALRAP